jgi:NTE family protein
MSTHAKARKPARKTHKEQDRHPFESIALLLQSGGALGAYEAAVYQALSEAHLHPVWVAGISIGAINSALIAVNAVTPLRPALRSCANSRSS